MSDWPDGFTAEEIRDGVRVREPRVLTDGGPWASHDVACPVCSINHAILDLHFGIFTPCDFCSSVGWALVCVRPRRARRIKNWMFRKSLGHRSFGWPGQ